MTDWQRLVIELRGTKMTLAAIGKRIGLATSSVGDIATKRTAKPRGDAAVKLVALHRERTGAHRKG